MESKIQTLQEAEENFPLFLGEALIVPPRGEPDETYRELLLEEEMGEVVTTAVHRWGPAARERVEALFHTYCQEYPAETTTRFHLSKDLGAALLMSAILLFSFMALLFSG